MALQQAGIILVAQNYAQYMAQLRAINAAQQQTFSGGATGTGAAANVNKQTQAFSGLSGVLGTVKGAMGALTAVYAAFMAIDAVRGLKQFMDASLQVAMRNETLAVSLQVVGKNAGYSAEQINYATSAVKAQGITSQAAMQSLLRMAQANIEFADAAGLARIAQDAAVIGNINSSEAFERMIYGIQSGQVEVLKTIGINVTFEQSYRDMAKQLGKNRMELSEVDKAQARTNAVMEAGKRIAGTYEAAMGTAGKQQQSLARYIENTQENLGNMLLPIEQVKIAMEIDLWKGLEAATRGFGLLSQALKVVADNLTKADEGIKKTGQTLAETSTFWENFGRGIYNASRALIQFHILAVASWEAILGGWSDEEFRKRVQEMAAEIPLLTESYDNLGKVAPISLAKIKTAVELANEALQKQADSLNAVMDALMQVEKIQNAYDKGRVKAEADRDAARRKNTEARDTGLQDARDTRLKAKWEAAVAYNQAIDKLEKDSAKARQAATTNYNNDMARLDEDYNRQVADIRAKGALDATRAAEDLSRELKRMDRDYKRSKLQGDRAFALDEKWLMAEGDVLGLMRAREQHALEEQSAAENYNSQKSDAQENAATASQRAREDQQQQLDDLRKALNEQKAERTASYTIELDDLRIAQEEQRAEIETAYAAKLAEIRQAFADQQTEIQERYADQATAIDTAYADQLQALSDSRDEQLKLLGESLRDAGVVTQAGMTELEGILNSLFGENKAGDALVKGWTDRGESAITAWADTLSAKIAAIEARMKALTEGTAAGTGTTAGGQTCALGTPGCIPVTPMRSGGSGVVTGPAMFAVEPGQREFVSFVPMGGRSRDMNINATVAGGIDIRGAEGASAGVVDAAVRVTMTELREAIRRMSKN